MKRKARIVKRLMALAAGLAAAASAHAGDTGVSPGAELKIVFFYTPGCRMCKEAKETVANVEAKYGAKVAVERIDMSDTAHGPAFARRLFGMLDAYGIDKTPSIAVFAGRHCLGGGEEIVEKLDQTVARTLAGPPEERSLIGETRAPARDRFSLLALSAAALADSINPCAFAAVVLLVSLLANAGKSKKEVFVIGSAFTAGVFSAYFMIGLFFFETIHKLSAYHVVSDLIFYAAFGLCLIGGCLSLYDAVMIWGGMKPEQMVLKLPPRLRDAIHRRMRAGVRNKSLVAGGFMLGATISFLEYACTGQVYMPAIAGLVRSETDRYRGAGLLLWYNTLFVLPLVGVFGVALLGVGSLRLATFVRNRTALVKFLLAVVFFGLGVWLWPALVWPPGAR